MSNFPDDMDWNRYDAVYGAHDDDTIGAVTDALSASAQLRAILTRAASEIEALRFGNVSPVEGLDVPDIIDMMRGDFMPRPDADIVAQIEENTL